MNNMIDISDSEVLFDPAAVLAAGLELRAAALKILDCTDPQAKVEATQSLVAYIEMGLVRLDVAVRFEMAEQPGRPAKPELISALKVPKRGVSTPEGRAGMIHALTHIEFNAINLALDALVRFEDLPADYYWDWWQVASEEALHFSMLSDHLATLGAAYGDFPAHSGLWDMAEQTRHSLADRMAMVPRTLEARGLDACPLMRDKLFHAGDVAGAMILDRILNDEIGHVIVGNRWFRYACEQNNVEPVLSYRQIRVNYNAPTLRPPLNIAARRAAGFAEEELQAWQAQIDGVAQP